MKVTEKSQRYCQLQTEDLMQKDNAEHEEYAREYRLNKITETENINTSLLWAGKCKTKEPPYTRTVRTVV